MGSVNETAIYLGLMMAIAMGMTAWRLAVGHVKVRTQVDGMLGFCLVVSSGLFLVAVLPGAQLP